MLGDIFFVLWDNEEYYWCWYGFVWKLRISSIYQHFEREHDYFSVERGTVRYIQTEPNSRIYKPEVGDLQTRSRGFTSPKSGIYHGKTT